jgi:hypothetical protein
LKYHCFAAAFFIAASNKKPGMGFNANWTGSVIDLKRRDFPHGATTSVHRVGRGLLPLVQSGRILRKTAAEKQKWKPHCAPICLMLSLNLSQIFLNSEAYAG